MKLEIIAHRGFSAIAPENTLAAFSSAIQHQANSLEFDVQLSFDGVPVIIHDPTVDRTTDGTGKVREKTLEQLKALDAGSWFSSEFCGEQIPTLKEALKAIKSAERKNSWFLQFIYVEVKESDYWSATDIDNLLQTIISEAWDDKCIIACFNEQFLAQVRNRFCGITLGYLIDSVAMYIEKLPKVAADGRATILSKHQVLWDNPSLVKVSNNLKVDIVAWTVDSQEDLQKLIARGVWRIVTNSLIGLSSKSTQQKKGSAC